MSFGILKKQFLVQDHSLDHELDHELDQVLALVAVFADNVTCHTIRSI